jgi:hypothetical protein
LGQSFPGFRASSFPGLYYGSLFPGFRASSFPGLYYGSLFPGFRGCHFMVIGAACLADEGRFFACHRCVFSCRLGANYVSDFGGCCLIFVH